MTFKVKLTMTLKRHGYLGNYMTVSLLLGFDLGCQSINIFGY